MSDSDFSSSNNPCLQKNLRPASSVLEVALNAHYLEFQRFLLRRVGDMATADDVLQNFCLQVMQSETQLRDERSAIGWLYTVLRSVLMDHFRRDSVRQRGDNRYAQERITLGEDRVEVDEVDTTCNCLRGLLPELKPDYAELLRRIDFLQEPREQVRVDLGISEQNLRVRLHRARLAVGVALKQHCGECCESQYRDCFCDHDSTSSESST